MTAVRRGWRSGLERVLFVSTLILGVSLSLLTHVAPSAPFALIGHSSALHPLTAADAAAARQWMTDRAAPSPDSPDADDDDDDDDGDPDEGCALPAFASPAPADRALNWLLIHPAIENPSSRASDGHSLRAPPQ